MSLNKLLGLCSRETRAEGDVLATEGQEGNDFFIIESGAVEVNQQSSQAPIATLGPGEFFGEIALLCDIPRTATVTAKEECILLKLDRDNFKAVVSHDFLAGIRLEQVAQERGRGT